MGKQIAVLFLDSTNPGPPWRSFFMGLKSHLGEEIIRDLLVFHNSKEENESVCNKRLRSFVDDDCRQHFIYLPLTDAHDHESIWRIFRESVVREMAKWTGATFHIFLYGGSSAIHAVWLLLEYSGCLPRPTKFWDCRKSVSGEYRLRQVLLPISSTYEEIQTSSEHGNLAYYDINSVRTTALKNSLDLLLCAARMKNVPLLVEGEKGTGKTRLLELTYGAAKRKDVVSILCGSLQPELAMSMLFGHVRGAFTDAKEDSRGYVGEAHDKILFLDEVQDLPRPVQRMIVRFLQDSDHKYRKVGSSKGDELSNTEIVFATHLSRENLSAVLDPDLFDRITLVTVSLPPLRELREDLPEMWKRVWKEHKQIDELQDEILNDELESWLISDPLSGNFRELISVALWIQIHYLRLRSPDNAIHEALLSRSKPPFERNSGNTTQGTVREHASFKDQVVDFKRIIVKRALDMEGSVGAAARSLGVDEKTIRNWLNPEENPSISDQEEIYPEIPSRMAEEHPKESE